MQELKILPLHSDHEKMKARFAPFAGWNMPLQYAGVVAEHVAVRTGVGLFDVSHMGEISVSGEDSEKFLQFVACNDLSKVASGRAQYSALLNEQGGVIDDIIIYRKSANDFLLCVNASNIDEDFAWLQKQAGTYSVLIENESDECCLLALQGPQAMRLAAEVFNNLPEKRFSFVDCECCVISRTGYTGEDGVEIFIPIAEAHRVFLKILEKGKAYNMQLCGLAARDTLRLEAAYPLHGHELSPSARADESGLSWIIKPAAKDFIGKSTLTVSPPARELVGLELMEPGIAREGAKVFSTMGQHIGVVTSGTKTPTVNKSIALARVDILNDERFLIEVRDKKLVAARVPIPFYSRA